MNNAGADKASILDKVGVATPSAMLFLTKQVRDAFDVPVSVHTQMGEFVLGQKAIGVEKIADLETMGCTKEENDGSRWICRTFTKRKAE